MREAQGKPHHQPRNNPSDWRSYLDKAHVLRLAARQLLHSLIALGERIVEVVNDDNLVSLVEQAQRRVTACDRRRSVGDRCANQWDGVSEKGVRQSSTGAVGSHQ